MPVKQLTSNRSTKIMLIVLSYVVVGVAGVAASNLVPRVLANKHLAQADASCKSYINLVLAGNLEAAYASSAADIKDNQSFEQYSEVLKALKTDTPQFVDGQTEISKDNNKQASCQYVVDGLPKTSEDRTDGIFELTLRKNSAFWEVSSITVQ